MTLKHTLASLAGAVAAMLLAACGNTTPVTAGSPTPAPTITPFVSSEYPTQTANAQPGGIVTGPNSSLWFTETAVNKIGELNTQAVVSEFTVPSANAQPLTIATGPDSALWFTESNLPQVGRITTIGGVVTEYNLGNPLARPWGIISGPDGALWVTDPGANGIWRVTTAGVPTFYPLATPNAKPTAITAGANGALWFLEASANKIGTIAPGAAAGSSPIEYSAGISPNAGLGVIIQGTDNALWFTEQNTGKIGRMTTSGVLTSETALTGVVGPFGLTAGLDGNYYIADSNGDAIAQFIPSTLKTSTFKIPTAASQPWWVTIGPDNEVYFTERTASKVGQFRYF